MNGLSPLSAALAAQTQADSLTVEPAKDEALLAKAREFEAVFITEMLSYAGFEEALAQQSGYGGEAFSRMLVETYAKNLSEKGGFGLAEKIYDQLKGAQS